MIRVTLLPPRCYLFGRRVHHGAVGLVLLLSDWHDRRRWLADLVRHPLA